MKLKRIASQDHRLEIILTIDQSQLRYKLGNGSPTEEKVVRLKSTCDCSLT